MIYLKQVVIYTKNFCPYCIKAVALLQSKNIIFKEIDVTFDEDKFREATERTDWDTVPQIFIDDEFIVGCNDLRRLEKEGRLNTLLGL